MKKQTGFTLIELAIVLVIIGLLLGGVLRGQELINSAKVKNLAADFRNIPVYIYGYQDKLVVVNSARPIMACTMRRRTGCNRRSALVIRSPYQSQLRECSQS